MFMKFRLLFTSAIFSLSICVSAQAQTILNEKNSDTSLWRRFQIAQANSLQRWAVQRSPQNELLTTVQANTRQSSDDDDYTVQTNTGQFGAGKDYVEKLNSNTVTIISGTPSGTWMYMAHDMSAVLDDDTNLRVLPIIGKGSAQNIRDILYLKGIDMGIVQANILQHFEKTGEVGKNIGERLRYITRLHNQEIHILARPEINTIEDLRGKRVNFANKGSGSQITAQLLFEKLNIDAIEVNMQINDSFEKLKSGEIAATFFSTGKPSGAFRRLKNKDGLKLLDIPYAGTVADNFYPTKFTHEDYPNLIPEGKTVSTLSESAVLVSFNWGEDTARYKRVAKFTKALFKKFDQFLLPPRHIKWQEVNLASKLPGWKRFAAAQEFLKDVTSSVGASAQKQLRHDFAVFLSNRPAEDTLDRERREELFREFLNWHKPQ